MPASSSARLNGRTLIVILLGLTLQLTACGGGNGSAPTVANAPSAPNANTGGGSDDDDDTDNDAGEEESTPVNLAWSEPYQRDEEYPNTVDLPQQLITMRDGIRLAATITLPADENGNAIDGPFPVIATFTGYNQALGAIGAADPALVKRG